MSRQFVQGGLSECCMALGFEKMEKGSLGAKWTDRINPMDKHMMLMMELRQFKPAPPAPQMFGNAGREHMEKYGSTKEQFAKIAYKNHRNSVNNPYSQFRDEYTLEQILAAPKVYDPLTKLQCCPTSDGSAAAIVASEAFVKRHGLEGQAVEITGMSMATDVPSTFEDKSCMKMVGFDMTRRAAESALGQAGKTAEAVQVVELHDCFSANELITYEALGLCKEGEAGAYIDRGDNDYGGKGAVVNPSGGLISKGHPLGATGLAQCCEMTWQLRGEAGKRQVNDLEVAMSHNLGLGGAAVVTVYERPKEWRSLPMKRAVSLGEGPPEAPASKL
jgi:sterol carrier protein 2